MHWLKKIWNKRWYTSEDGYKGASRARIERRAVKEETRLEVKANTVYDISITPEGTTVAERPPLEPSADDDEFCGCELCYFENEE
jgi:hypothetical protein